MMDERITAVAQPTGCPFATPAPPRSHTAAFYCRLPNGRVHVPTPDERALYCRTGRYHLCPVARRYVIES